MTPESDNYSPAAPPRGVLEAQPPCGVIEHKRFLPSEELAEHIAHFWWVRWDLEAPYLAATLPHPVVHLTLERAPRRARVVGVPSRRFERPLEDSGQVLGVKFRPATFSTLWAGPVADLVDCRRSLSECLAIDMTELAPVYHAEEPIPAIAALEGVLASRLEPLPSRVRALRDLVERAESEREWTRAAQLASALGVGLRTLQRRFVADVGLSPKQVLSRYRLIEAAEQLARPSSQPGERRENLADIAVRLEYFDESHFVRDFKSFVGCTPAEYVRRAAEKD